MSAVCGLVVPNVDQSLIEIVGVVEVEPAFDVVERSECLGRTRDFKRGDLSIGVCVE